MTCENDGSLNRVWLRGFLRGVDCRPVQFRDALGTTLVCSLCGLVARRMASLRCSHVFCEFCLEQCTGGVFGVEKRCIFDQQTTDVSDVGAVRWYETQPLDLVKAKVRCWNARYGCDFTGPLRGLLDHFEQDCTYHVVICPRCQSMQVRSKLADHYRRGCVAPPAINSLGCHQLPGASVSSNRQDAASLSLTQDTIAGIPLSGHNNQ
nr:RING finger protein 151-like [Rhipicephalus microplus]